MKKLLNLMQSDLKKANNRLDVWKQQLNSSNTVNISECINAILVEKTTIRTLKQVIFDIESAIREQDNKFDY